MKKILLGTTAVVALGAFSTEAFAADKIKLGLGGFLRDYVSLSNHDTAAGAAKRMKLGQFQNSEVYVTGSTTLDNGIAVAARVEIETNGEDSGNSTDRVHMTLSSDQMGALRLGVAAHMADDHAVRAPMHGKFDWGDKNTQFTTYNGTGDANNSAGDLGDFGDNTIKIGYQTPEFSGVTAYASYGVAEGAGTSNGRNLQRSATDDSGSYGLAYSGEMGGTSVSAHVGQYFFAGSTTAQGDGSQATNNDGFKKTHVGVNVGMAGFTIGGAYQDVDGAATATAAIESLSGNAWELGVAYETGPYSVAGTYMRSVADGTTAVGSDKWTAYSVGVGYDMGAGVGLTAEYVRNKYTVEGNVANGSTTASALIAGVEVGF